MDQRTKNNLNDTLSVIFMFALIIGFAVFLAKGCTAVKKIGLKNIIGEYWEGQK